MQHESLTRQIIGCAMKVHRALGPGFLESVYTRALAYEMGAMGLTVECGKRIQVRYIHAVVRDFFADMLVCDCVLIENKAVQGLVPAHEAQLVNYLTATGIEIGLLLNFGASQLQFRRKTRGYRNRTARQDEPDGQDKRDASVRDARPRTDGNSCPTCGDSQTTEETIL